MTRPRIHLILSYLRECFALNHFQHHLLFSSLQRLCSHILFAVVHYGFISYFKGSNFYKELYLFREKAEWPIIYAQSEW